MNSALRVGVLVPRFEPFRGGMETYVAGAAAALAASGVDLTVITQVPRTLELPRHEVLNGYTLERHQLPVGGSFDVPSPSAARAATRPGRFDVLWVHNYHTPLAWLATEQAKAPVVFTPHYHGVGNTPLRQALHRPYRLAGRRLMAASRRIVVDTDAEAGLVLRDFPRQVQREKVKVVPLAVTNPVRGRQPYPSDLPVVLTVARQEPYKRTDLLIRAVAELRDRSVPARLIVVGDGSGMEANRQLVAHLNAEEVVAFTGAVDDATLGRWWASAALYATASEQEAFGIGLAEALVAGLPVVASGIPAHREVVRRAGPGVAAELCPPDTSDAVATSLYADAIAQLLDSPGASKNRAERCLLPRPADMAGQLMDTLTSVGVGSCA